MKMMTMGANNAVSSVSVQLLIITTLILSSCGVVPLPPALAYYTTHTYHHQVPVEEKITNIRTYIHDILSGNNPTAVQIARPNNTNNKDAADAGPTPFGSLFALDDPLTDGPHLNKSKIVGNAKGTYLSASRDKNAFTLVMGISLSFTAGDLKGSTINVFSRNPVTEKFRELAIVGGTGKFRMARGYLNVSTVSFDAATGDAVLQYDITVIHH